MKRSGLSIHLHFWIPGKHDGYPVNVSFTFPVDFVIDQNLQNKKDTIPGVSKAFQNGWFYEIIQKHRIKLNNYNFIKVFIVGTQPGETWYGLGYSDSLEHRNLQLKNAIYISRNSEGGYSIITSESANHDLDNEIIAMTNGKMESYSSHIENYTPTKVSNFKECKIFVRQNRMMVSSIRSTLSLP